MGPELDEWLVPEPGPSTLQTRPWGGTRLESLRPVPHGLARPIGESWEFSTLDGAESRSRGRPLSQCLGAPLPYLVKLIDTARALSIQLHPDDDPSQGVVGKEEAWIVLDASPGAKVLAGLRPEVDARELRARAQAAFADPQAAGPALVDSLQPIEVRAGSVVFVPARTLHAIQGGILLAEIQQPSDCTFRLFDYGSERPTHPEAVFEHLDPRAQPGVWQPGDAPRSLRGKHLELSVHTRGEQLESSVTGDGTPRLLVPVRGRIQASGAKGRATLTPGDLRLQHAGDLRLELSDDAQLVVGRLR